MFHHHYKETPGPPIESSRVGSVRLLQGHEELQAAVERREISSAEQSTSTSDGLVVMTASSTKAKATQSTWCPSIPRPRRPDNRMTQLQSPTPTLRATVMGKELATVP